MGFQNVFLIELFFVCDLEIINISTSSSLMHASHLRHKRAMTDVPINDI